MKRKGFSIKGHFFLVMILFCAILIGVLWILQIVYLDDFYKFIKKKEAQATFHELISLVEQENENLEIKVNTLAREHSVAVLITDSNVTSYISAEYSIGSSLLNMPVSTFKQFEQAAINNGGEIAISFVGNENMTLGKPDGMMDFGNEMVNPDDDKHGAFPQNHGRERGESAIYIAVQTIDDVDYVIMMNMVLTPVTSTVETLKVQLGVITVILVALSIIISLIVSRHVTKPIIQTTETAKKLAQGEFEVHFNDRQYREIGELTDTLNYAAQELGKTEQFRQELIANVSHDLRTPLTMITGYAEVMRDLPGENTPENVQVVIDEANRLTNLVNDMLDISKLQSGVLEMKPVAYNLTESIRRVLNRYNKLREQDGFVIVFNATEDVEIFADEEKIYQVIYNLINNAINYTGEDKTVIVNQIINENGVRIEVTDSGEGIPQEELENVWERYYKVDKSHKRSIQGTGLGLSIVKNILKMHNAKFGVNSKMGEGSTFFFELPIVQK